MLLDLHRKMSVAGRAVHTMLARNARQAQKILADRAGAVNMGLAVTDTVGGTQDSAAAPAEESGDACPQRWLFFCSFFHAPTSPFGIIMLSIIL